MGNIWEINGTYGDLWEKNTKIAIENVTFFLSYGKYMGNRWEIYGKYMGNIWEIIHGWLVCKKKSY